MKKILSLMAVAGIAAAFAAPAHADEFVARYTYMLNGAAPTVITQPAVLEKSCGQVITQPAVLESTTCGDKVITQPVVLENGYKVLSQPAVINTNPVTIEDHENIVPHFFHIGLWPLVDFSVF